MKARQRGQAVRLEVAAGGDEELIREIIEAESIRDGEEGSPDSYSEVYRVNGPVDLTSMMELMKIPGRELLRDPPFTPQPPRGRGQRGTEDLFAAIRRQDILLHHPYDSFEPVVEFVSRAAKDPNVLAIKQTLYRTSGDSPITRALIQAAEAGKHVTALVELKARFDEEANVSWARQMERAGVHVVFGFLDLKTHCKVSLVVRQEGGVVRRYVHMGTGNYNPTTALVYTDLGLFTADEDIAADASALFNLLTGYSQGHRWRKLIVAPTDLHRRTIELIDEQTQRAREGRPSSNLRQAEFAGGLSRDRGPVPRQPGGRAHRTDHPRHLLPAAGLAGHFRKYPRPQHRRPVSGTQPDLRFQPRRRSPGVPGQRGLDAAKLLPPRGNHVPGGIAPAQAADSFRDHAGLFARQPQGPHAALRRQPRAVAPSAGRAIASLPGRIADHSASDRAVGSNDHRQRRTA